MAKEVKTKTALFLYGLAFIIGGLGLNNKNILTAAWVIIGIVAIVTTLLDN